ncbi:hypothetical protein PR202_ga15603 [Eleusine coracana subsp. coracana]|uniref:Patatin n=1 Tax=Eleusine coracana subsp. coracana TaxID=191504 RepID=A0AAV5CKK6_ELECO|nr:hypothetical protein PR202_ga15603 [Eleusine coracana subsp. coracana]
MEIERHIQPPTYGNLVTVLSIDGGGIRGIIPAVVLTFLESELQFFHVSICFLSFFRGAFGKMMKIFRSLSGPSYDGKYLHEIVRKKLGSTRLHQTLTNVVIPTFDIKRLQPIIFSSYEVWLFLFVKNNKYSTMDALLSDICISTSAAPTYLPSHYFKTEDCHGNIKEFHLIDGGVAANNPALVGIGEVTKQIFKENPDFFPIKPMDYGRFLVISLGTGSSKFEANYSAQKAKSWGVLGWLFGNGSTPLVDVFTQASADMVDIHIAAVFKALHSENNYLRIQQDDTLQGTLSSVDVATKENLEKLSDIGAMLLKKPVSQANLETGHMEPACNSTDMTNEEALKRFAKLLSDERRIRKARSPK